MEFYIKDNFIFWNILNKKKIKYNKNNNKFYIKSLDNFKKKFIRINFYYFESRGGVGV